MDKTYEEKARAIVEAAQGLKYCEWRRIAHAIDREYEEAANRAKLAQNAAEDVMIRIARES